MPAATSFDVDLAFAFKQRQYFYARSLQQLAPPRWGDHMASKSWSQIVWRCHHQPFQQTKVSNYSNRGVQRRQRRSRIGRSSVEAQSLPWTISPESCFPFTASTSAARPLATHIACALQVPITLEKFRREEKTFLHSKTRDDEFAIIESQWPHYRTEVNKKRVSVALLRASSLSWMANMNS